MEKKIFIFKPSEKWSYCGGGLAIIAYDFDGCKQYFDENLYISEESVPDSPSYDKWVLVASFGVTGDPALGKVFDDYNWG